MIATSIQYRERSDRMPALNMRFKSSCDYRVPASGRFARGTVLGGDHVFSVRSWTLTLTLDRRTGSGSMKGMSRKKFLPGRQKFLAASHSTHPKLLNANHHASYCPVLYCLCLSPI